MAPENWGTQWPQRLRICEFVRVCVHVVQGTGLMDRQITVGSQIHVHLPQQLQGVARGWEGHPGGTEEGVWAIHPGVQQDSVLTNTQCSKGRPRCEILSTTPHWISGRQSSLPKPQLYHLPNRSNNSHVAGW